MLGFKKWVPAFVTVMASGAASAGGLTGMQMEGGVGSLSFSPGGAVTACPASFVVGAGIECAYSDAANSFTFDFTDGQLIIDQYVNAGYSSSPWTFVVYQSHLQQLSDMVVAYSDFPSTIPSAGITLPTYSISHLNGSIPYRTQLLVHFNGVTDGDHHYRMVFDLASAPNPVPEPASYALMAAGMAVVLAIARRRGRKQAG